MTEWLTSTAVNVKGGKIEHQIKERPLLHVCCAEDHFGTVNVDIRPEVNPDFVCDAREGLPFKDDEFVAAFADLPWIEKFRWDSTKVIKNMLRVSPIVYIICPWLYGAKTCYPESINVSWRPGINHPILFVKYIRRGSSADKQIKI